VAPLLEATNLTKQFETLTAVDDITFTVAEGQVLALLGPNGAGKTTTVRMLSSIIQPTSGSAQIAGFDVVRDAARVRHLVGHLTEFPGLYLRMRARDYLDFFGELQGMARESRRARADQLLQRFGLWDARDRRLGGFSKGMRQKVALIRAMLHQPRVLFLDEPTSAMDPQSAKQVRDAIADVRRDGHTVILCTHNLHEAEALADNIAVIRRGKLVAFGTPEQLKLDLLGAPVWQVRLAQPIIEWPSLNSVLHVESADALTMHYRTSQPEIANPMVLRELHARGAHVMTLTEEPRSLEQGYLKLVQ